MIRIVPLLALGLIGLIPDLGCEAGEAVPKPIVITTKSIAVPAARLNGLKQDGAWLLTSENISFGGISGLIIGPNEIIAVTDKARKIRANWSIELGALSLSSATVISLEEAGRGVLSGKAGDAESLAVSGDDLLISFERNHRILRLGPDDVLVPWAVPEGIEDLGSNSGLEAIVTLPDGAVLAIAEDVVDGGAPIWIFRDQVLIHRGVLPLASRHKVTGAALGPDDALFLVLRDYSVVDGVSIRVERYALHEGLPDPASRVELAAFEEESGIDNMEGIAVVEEASGATTLWIVSDDNFNPLQRTILLRFVLADRP